MHRYPVHAPSPRALVRAVLAYTDFSKLACAATLVLQPHEQERRLTGCKAGGTARRRQRSPVMPCGRAGGPPRSHVGREVLDCNPLALRVQQQQVFDDRYGGVHDFRHWAEGMLASVKDCSQ